MTNNVSLISIKVFHTVIWFVFVFAIFYIIIAGILNKIDKFLYFCIGSVFFEGIILMLFKWKCPLTVIALKYSKSNEPGFDIYLPKWLAKNNKLIFTTLFVSGLIIVLLRINKMI
jgi:hypothetical protein